MENEISQSVNKASRFKLIIFAAVILIFLILAAGALFIYFSNPSLGFADLSWNPNMELNLAGYRIYYGDAKRTADCPAGGYTEKIDVGNSVSHKIAGLQPEKTYYFSVTSYNAAGAESCFSQEVSKKISQTAYTQKIKYYSERFFNPLKR